MLTLPPYPLRVRYIRGKLEGPCIAVILFKLSPSVPVKKSADYSLGLRETCNLRASAKGDTGFGLIIPYRKRMKYFYEHTQIFSVAYSECIRNAAVETLLWVFPPFSEIHSFDSCWELLRTGSQYSCMHYVNRWLFSRRKGQLLIKWALMIWKTFDVLVGIMQVEIEPLPSPSPRKDTMNFRRSLRWLSEINHSKFSLPLHGPLKFKTLNRGHYYIIKFQKHRHGNTLRCHTSEMSFSKEANTFISVPSQNLVEHLRRYTGAFPGRFEKLEWPAKMKESRLPGGFRVADRPKILGRKSAIPAEMKGRSLGGSNERGVCEVVSICHHTLVTDKWLSITSICPG